MKAIVTGVLYLTLNPNSIAFADASLGNGTPPAVVNRTQSAAPPILNDTVDVKYLRRLKRTAISAIAMSVITAGLYVASDALFYADHETPASAMGLTGLGLTGGLAPVFYLSNRSAYRHFGAGGLTSLQTWGWIASSLAVADVLGVVVAGYGASITPMYGLISIAGLFTAIGFTLFAVDGLHARKQIRTSLKRRQSNAQPPSWSPFVSEVIATRQQQRRGAVVGITGTF